MDVIVEGKITEDEGIDEVLRTCAAIKSVQTPILRINDNLSDLQGRVAFSQGGYIIGGKIGSTGENGYGAIRKLLAVSDGNYAILDPLRKHISDVNQSLWIKVDKVVPLLPDLPESPEGLIDKVPDMLPGSVSRPKTGQVDISSGVSMEAADGEEGPVKVDAKSKSRRFNLGTWRVARTVLKVGMLVALVVAGYYYRKEIMSFLGNMMMHG